MGIKIGQKMIIFKSILVSFWSPFFKNEIENKNKNELKMDEKGQLWTILMLVSTSPSIRVFFKKIIILKYYLFGLGEGYTLTTGTPTSIDVWIAATRHSFCLFLHFFKYKNAVNNDKLSSSSKLSNFKDKSKQH